MKKLYFITGSQDLYGNETLKQVAVDSKELVDFLNEKLCDTIKIEWKPTVLTNDGAKDILPAVRIYTVTRH